MLDVMVGLRRHLLDSAAIAAVVTARIYTPILPQKVTYPAIQLQLITDLEALQMRGPDGVVRVRVQVDAWAATRDAAADLGRRCVQRLNGFLGTWLGDASTSPAGTLTVLGVGLLDASEHFEQDVQGGMCRHRADYTIHYRGVEPPDVTTSLARGSALRSPSREQARHGKRTIVEE